MDALIAQPAFLSLAFTLIFFIYGKKGSNENLDFVFAISAIIFFMLFLQGIAIKFDFPIVFLTAGYAIIALTMLKTTIVLLKECMKWETNPPDDFSGDGD